MASRPLANSQKAAGTGTAVMVKRLSTGMLSSEVLSIRSRSIPVKLKFTRAGVVLNTALVIWKL